MVFGGFSFGWLCNGLQRGVGNIHGGSGFKSLHLFILSFLLVLYVVLYRMHYTIVGV